MPHVPRMLPVLISDPEMREKVSDTFTSQEFMDNLEGYFVDNIKVIYIPICNELQVFLYSQGVKTINFLVHFTNILALGDISFPPSKGILKLTSIERIPERDITLVFF